MEDLSNALMSLCPAKLTEAQAVQVIAVIVVVVLMEMGEAERRIVLKKVNAQLMEERVARIMKIIPTDSMEMVEMVAS
jgi:hypothetical protein